MKRIAGDLSILGSIALIFFAIPASAQSGQQNFRKACILGLQLDYRANSSRPPSSSNLAKVSSGGINSACGCVTNAFVQAGIPKQEIVNRGIVPSEFGMRLKLVRIGWFGRGGQYIDESVETDERDYDSLQRKYRGNPLNNLRNMFSPPPKELFIKRAEHCYRTIDPQRYGR